MEERIGRIVNHEVTLMASGRTDAGVHALNQVANFRTGSGIPCEALQRGLNALLPHDIVVKEVSEVDENFHSRFSAKGKAYTYQFLNRPYPSALLKRFSWFIRHPLDMDMMSEAAFHIIGEHDFSSFRASSCTAPHPVKTVRSASFRREGELIVFGIEANGFLHHMVRNIVGTLVEVGAGKRTPLSFKELLYMRDRRFAGITSPPHGLFLKEVRY
jgi:tRNA pseudouridine38-40 synthase